VTSSAVLKLAFGVILLLVMFVLAIGAKRTTSIGTLLVLIPFQTIDTQYASSSVLIAYVLAAALLISGGVRVRMLSAAGLIVLAYFVSVALADRSLFTHHVLFMFQFFSCLVVFVLAYNFALLVEDEHTIAKVLFAINCLAIVYCLLQLSVGPGERFIPFGISEFEFNMNRDPSDPRLVGPFDNAGSTAGYFSLMSLVCAFEIMFSIGRRRALVWILMGFNLLGLVATGNRAGFLVLMGMAPLLILAYRKELGMRRVLTLSIGGVTALAIAATIAVTFTDFNNMFSRMETVAETENGVPETRAENWPIAIEKIKRNPWFGEGPFFLTAEDAERTGQLQTEYQEGGALDTAYDRYPHSLYLYLLRTVGIFGLLGVIGFFVRTWFVLFGALRKESLGGYQAAFVRLGLFLIPAFLIAQITLEFNRPTTMDYAQFIFALMGLLIGMSDRRVREAGRMEMRHA
jgi:hypothetical protein